MVSPVISRAEGECNMTLAGYRVDSCNGYSKAYLVGESHDRKKCTECATKEATNMNKVCEKCGWLWNEEQTPIY